MTRLAERPTSDSRTILVVDDEPGAILAVSRTLGDVARIIFARDGIAALQLLRDEPVDLILLDAEMPGASGLEVLRAMQQDQALASIPAIFLTSHRDEATEEAALAGGAVDFISKPIRPGILRARVRTQLRLRAVLDRLVELSSTDALTGLANRRAFEERLAICSATAFRAASPLSVVMVDVDHFKKFNDEYGHLAGDEALVEIGRCLDSVARRPADLAARWGGEEFALVLPATDRAGALALAEKVRERVWERNIPHRGVEAGRLTLSIGCMTFVPTGHASSPEVSGLMAQADAALYRAKHAGRNRVEVVGIDPVHSPSSAP